MTKKGLHNHVTQYINLGLFNWFWWSQENVESLSLKTVVVRKNVTSLRMETNRRKGGPVHRVPWTKSREKLQKLFQSVCVLFCKYKHCNLFQLVFASFSATRYVCYDQSAKVYSLSLIFSTLCVVHDLIFQRKLSRRRLPIGFVHFVSHASSLALRPITFTQRFRTTWHLFSIQLIWKPKILNVEDKWTKFERSKGDLGQFPESCKWSLTLVQLSKHIDLRCF